MKKYICKFTLYKSNKRNVENLIFCLILIFKVSIQSNTFHYGILIHMYHTLCLFVPIIPSCCLLLPNKQSWLLSCYKYSITLFLSFSLASLAFLFASLPAPFLPCVHPHPHPHPLMCTHTSVSQLWGEMQFVWVWLASLNAMTSSYIHFPVALVVPFTFWDESNFNVFMFYIFLFTCQPDEYLD